MERDPVVGGGVEWAWEVSHTLSIFHPLLGPWCLLLLVGSWRLRTWKLVWKLFWTKPVGGTLHSVQGSCGAEIGSLAQCLKGKKLGLGESTKQSSPHVLLPPIFYLCFISFSPVLQQEA